MKPSNPMTCVDLIDIPEIREEALAEYGKDIRIATNKLSDALGLTASNRILRHLPHTIPSRFKKTSINVVEQDGGVLIELEKFTVLIKQK